MTYTVKYIQCYIFGIFTKAMRNKILARGICKPVYIMVKKKNGLYWQKVDEWNLITGGIDILANGYSC